MLRKSFWVNLLGKGYPAPNHLPLVHRPDEGALQESEFSDSTLPPGVAFCKLPGRTPERIRCWGAAQ